MKYLLFTAEVFFDTPSGEVCFCDFANILFGMDEFVGGKHHGMFGNAINKNQADIFFESCYLEFDRARSMY